MDERNAKSHGFELKISNTKDWTPGLTTPAHLSAMQCGVSSANIFSIHTTTDVIQHRCPKAPCLRSENVTSECDDAVK